MGIGRRSFLSSFGGVGTALAAFAGAQNLSAQAPRPAGTASQGSAPGLSEGKSGFMTPGPTGGMTERADYKKIKIPYKERRGISFPKGARIAVTHELAAEYWEAGVVNQGQPGARGPNWNQISRTSWFNWEVGIPRALDVYDRYDIKATAIFNALGALYYPELTKEIAQRGHEIAAHSWDHGMGVPTMSRELERMSVRREIEVLTKSSGVRPVGMLNNGGTGSGDTPEFIAEEGFLWHGDNRDDTLPYGLQYKDKLLVRIPHCNYTHNDPAVFGRAPTDFHFSPQKGFEYLKETIEAQLEWAEHEPSVMQIGIHPFFGCYPDRMLTFDRTFAYLRSLPESKVWMCTYKELAEYWKKTYLS